MKKLMKIVHDEEEVAIDVIPLATKPPSIVDYKILKEGKISYDQIIRANGSSKRYPAFIQMLKSFDREDLETMWKLVKAKYGYTRPEEGYERVLWGDLKTMFEHHVEDLGRIIGIKRLLDDLEVTATQMYVTTASINNALGYSTFRGHPDLGVLQIGIRAKVIENQGADDEEISEGGIPRVIVYGYDGLPIQPVATPSPDYIPGLEDPQTPPVPQDEDEREPMFVQVHDPDYVSEPVYPKYIPLKDEHVFPAEDQPLPPIDLPTDESPGYITESGPEEDPEEYEDDETEDCPVDYPMDGGDDEDDDDGDSSRDDADDEVEDDEDEEEEEHLAPADSTIVVPTDEHASISLPPEAEVEILLVMTTPSPSPPISLSPPSAGERLARCMAPPAHSSPPPAFIDIVTASLPSPPLPPLPSSLYISPLVDHRDDIPETELPPRKRLCLSTLGSRYEIRARPIRGRGIDYGLVSTVDAEARRHGISEIGYGIRDTWVDPVEAVPKVAPMTVGEVNTRVTELAELHEHDTHDLYALLEDAQDSRSVWIVEEEAYASREAWAHSIGLSQATHQELQTHRDHVYAYETHIQAHQAQLQLQSTLIQTQHQVYETRFQMQQAEIAALRESDRRRQAQMAETL
ncbi:hypothetical protein Tco_0990855 [Tanacetum coccineum]|uniref:Uncharacterized protein n=1 Tax=Tanacetum coccineum TaxID=301880 RepID=A0ABQ5EXM4_9ASTR